jgi:N-acetylneuraminate synthase/N,N'-diacetyllegionaminate synthase
MHHLDLSRTAFAPGKPVFVIAEAGVNHNGDVAVAHRMIDVAADSGADAVKFQTFRAERLVTSSAPKARYQQATTGADGTQLEMIRGLELSAEAHVELKRHCEQRSITFLSTPFDEESLALLASIGVPALKVASGDLTNHPFLRRIARERVPVLLSTGMSTIGEVDAAVEVLREAGCSELALLHCVSCYPAPYEDVNLRAIHTLQAAFGLPVGLSDHTMGIEIPIAAVAMGARIIEKHFTLSRAMAGPDHRASLEPKELVAMMRAIRNVERALGTGEKRPVASESDARIVGRRSLALAVDLPAGAVIEPEMLTALRPATGISPALGSLVTGRTARRALRAGALLGWEDLDVR